MTALMMRWIAACVALAGATPLLMSCGGQAGDSESADTSAMAVAYLTNASHSAVAAGNDPFLSSAPAWTRSFDGTLSYALIARQRAFVLVSRMGASSLYALDVVSGTVAWGPVPIAGSATATGHTYADGKVFVATAGGDLLAFDVASGARRWSARLGASAVSAAPTAWRGLVYVGVPGFVQAFEQASGTLRWSTAVQGGALSSPAVSELGVFVSYSCQTYSLNALTGAIQWHIDEACVGGDGRTVVLAGDLAYVRDAGRSALSEIAVRDARSGALRSSSTAFDGVTLISAPAATGDAVFVVSDGRLRRFDPLLRSVSWTFADRFVFSAPVVVGNQVFVASASGLDAVDAVSGQSVQRGQLEVFPSQLGEPITWPAGAMAIGEGWLLVPAGSQLNAWYVARR